MKHWLFKHLFKKEYKTLQELQKQSESNRQLIASLVALLHARPDTTLLLEQLASLETPCIKDENKCSYYSYAMIYGKDIHMCSNPCLNYYQRVAQELLNSRFREDTDV